MICEICQKEVKLKNSVICSDKCKNIRLKVIRIGNKLFPTPGCESCLGDLHQSCTDKCNKEFRESMNCFKELWSLIRLVYPKKEANP